MTGRGPVMNAGMMIYELYVTVNTYCTVTKVGETGKPSARLRMSGVLLLTLTLLSHTDGPGEETVNT